MKKLLFVDHSYHAKTRATAFLQELPAQSFDVETLWDGSWARGARLSAKPLNACCRALKTDQQIEVLRAEN